MAARSFAEGGLGQADRAMLISEALAWVGTPYRHQGVAKGVGCDCLGLVRGVWRAFYGCNLDDPGPYAPDWADAGGEVLHDGMRRHFRKRPVAEAEPGDVLLFRWRPVLPARHAGILIEPEAFVHAYEGGGAVVRSTLVPQWRRRIAAVFAFPDL